MRKKSPNILKGCSYYTASMMENGNTEDWRIKVDKRLQPLGIQQFTPYRKPFLKSVGEDDSDRIKLKYLRETGQFDLLAEYVSEIRAFDLNLIERTDFCIAKIHPKIASYGTCSELERCHLLNKPTFIAVDGGIKETPLWLFSMFPHKYFYNNIDEIIVMIENINSGKQPIDSKRWRLLMKKFRY